MKNNAKIPIPLRIIAPKTHVRESTHDCNYSWSPASYPCKATISNQKGWDSHL